MMSFYSRLASIYAQHERLLMPGILLSGVTVDFITFRTIRIETAFAFLCGYLALAGIAITITNTASSESYELATWRYLRLAAPLVVQFTFGALLSASFIFYWYSGTLSVSWPILLLSAFLMASNDYLRHSFLNPVVQLTVYFFALFSLTSLILPALCNSISAWVFLSAGLLSLTLMFLYLGVLFRVAEHIRPSRSTLLASIGSVFLLMNALYFTGIIPPIPLSVREAGVYHSVERSGTDYVLLAEDESPLSRILRGRVIHTQATDRVYVFSSVFAPAELNTIIAHDWFYYDEASREWIDRGRPTFRITGGRQGGYRGFSFATHINKGQWRVDIETERGQVLGRLRFRVEFINDSPVLVRVVR